MYLKSQSDPDLFTVGFYKPDGTWEEPKEDEHYYPPTASETADKVSALREDEWDRRREDREREDPERFE